VFLSLQFDVYRMTAAKKTCEDLSIYLMECKKLIGTTAAAVMTMPSFGKDENGTIRQAAIAQGTILLSRASISMLQ
jgi:hypothetical protein